ncbi:unnamed protein product [Schistosoma turkestanicum]|nr:unnamed protein product [Schistosoma turkestanicum]
MFGISNRKQQYGVVESVEFSTGDHKPHSIKTPLWITELQAMKSRLFLNYHQVNQEWSLHHYKAFHWQRCS